MYIHPHRFVKKITVAVTQEEEKLDIIYFRSVHTVLTGYQHDRGISLMIWRTSSVWMVTVYASRMRYVATFESMVSVSGIKCVMKRLVATGSTVAKSGSVTVDYYGIDL
ncbi:hypothetical protein BDR07DRAFT_148813 [Suillus spraguei]|nr:hypothetical protein BDR07DRAFT_148813 [Suillus spraguei]